MGRKNFLKFSSLYDVKSWAASDENLFQQTLYEIQCKLAVKLKKIMSPRFFSCEYCTNFASNDDNCTVCYTDWKECKSVW